MRVRPEAGGDEAGIGYVVATAFAASRHGHNGEAGIVERLRERGELAVSLVAEIEVAGIVGHIAFSPVAIADGARDWFGLGPVAVLPAHRRAGIGAALIEAGIAQLRARGAAGCVVLGDPRFYARFGFLRDLALSFPGPPPSAFQRVVWSQSAPRGVVSYSPAFG